MPTTPNNNLKIWRYMDLSGFISLVVNEALYFPCAADFKDPFEGYLPASHTQAMLSISKKAFAPLMQQLGGIASPNYEQLHARVTEQVKRKNGVSCWHINDYESEAMWRLYADKGIAVESTVGQLRDSLPSEVHGNRIHIYEIRYADYENAEIDKGHEHYILAMKRKSFEHERELRASLSLPLDGQGIYVPCNLERLITKIHVSPLSHEHIRDDLEKLFGNMAKPLRIPILRSALYDRPV